MKITEVMEMRNVPYEERPHAIWAFKRAGFPVEDINVTRTDACHYDMMASKTVSK